MQLSSTEVDLSADDDGTKDVDDIIAVEDNTFNNDDYDTEYIDNYYNQTCDDVNINDKDENEKHYTCIDEKVYDDNGTW